MTAGSWVDLSRGGEGRLRLFCFPHAGGGASTFRLWPAAVPESVEIARVQIPGRETRFREPRFTDLGTLAARLVEELGPWDEQPYAFFGHSMGALVAFRLTQEILAAGFPPPVHLFAAGYRAPHSSMDSPIRELPDAEFLKAMDRRYGGIPAALVENQELRELFLPVLRDDMSICESNDDRGKNPVACPITAFGGRDDPWVGSEHLNSWKDQTQATFRLKTYDGGHFFLDAHREAILRELQADLAPHLKALV